MPDMDELVAGVIRSAADRVPAFADRLRAAGISATSIQGVRDLDALPVLSKDDVLELQRERPPFGGLLDPGADVRRVFQSPGPIYEPQLTGADPWRWGSALAACGITRSDVLLNCFSYHLSPAGAMFEEAGLALGCTVLPGGVGNLDLQAQAIADLDVTAYAGLPSYLKSLVERYNSAGLDPARWQLTKALVTAEPLPGDLRGWLEQRVPVVRMAYGTAETGLLGYEVEPGAGLVVPDGVLVQVCDLDTGEPLDEGEGQIVVTLLRPEYPLVRFGTGDLSAWLPGPAGERRLAGVLGRVGAAVKVRGMFLHPRQVEATMRSMDGVAAYRFVVDRVDHRDTLRCEVLPSPGAHPEQVGAEVRDRVKAELRLTTEVELVEHVEDTSVLVDVRLWDSG
ncbi:phenylacetate--CoA ligase family protein [Phytoactinopolyspora mesophila]|uniref:Phenylacetate--CoA ligase family protein n=1 Tax=Phytoactinopolyspora mesophila TaxID=2650750 RepID=A0A7K3M7T9_9ACTN|nr:phenylacetate--CoA ligase [Phytoactinopolyspora mesophila]NDL59117.1 phenylacetate--CoA ligase family protein [Phytoactinopolyspora mesophila]